MLRKFWITENDAGLSSITFESKDPSTQVKLSIREALFPDNPSTEHPLRHTINLGLFNDSDLQCIHDVIGEYLGL
jgi:hypothetical protein